MGKGAAFKSFDKDGNGLNPCFGGFGWESGICQFVYNKRNSLNPCFGGFGWESGEEVKYLFANDLVLILVLVDLGGKAGRRD